MKVICEKANEYEICESCDHSKVHDQTLPKCLNARCYMVANAFAIKNIDCTRCEYSETCEQYDAKKQSSIEFKRRKQQAEKTGKDYEEPDERILEIQQRLQNPVVNLLTHGEDCGKYRELFFYVKCKEV
jgi:hypothetical protein